jgi:hypothetical protein
VGVEWEEVDRKSEAERSVDGVSDCKHDLRSE